jgi:hypothetical protein
VSVAPDAESTRNDAVDSIMINDPDGNSLAFAMPKDAAVNACRFREPLWSVTVRV